MQGGRGKSGGAEVRGRSHGARGSLSGLGGDESHWRALSRGVSAPPGSLWLMWGEETAGLRAEGGRPVRRLQQASRQESTVACMRVVPGGVRSSWTLDCSEHPPNTTGSGLCSSELLPCDNPQTELKMVRIILLSVMVLGAQGFGTGLAGWMAGRERCEPSGRLSPSPGPPGPLCLVCGGLIALPDSMAAQNPRVEGPKRSKQKLPCLF